MHVALQAIRAYACLQRTQSHKSKSLFTHVPFRESQSRKSVFSEACPDDAKPLAGCAILQGHTPIIYLSGNMDRNLSM